MKEISILDETKIMFKNGETLTLKPLEVSSIWVNPEEIIIIIVKGPKKERL